MEELHPSAEQNTKAGMTNFTHVHIIFDRQATHCISITGCIRWHCSSWYDQLWGIVLAKDWRNGMACMIPNCILMKCSKTGISLQYGWLLPIHLLTVSVEKTSCEQVQWPKSGGTKWYQRAFQWNAPKPVMTLCLITCLLMHVSSGSWQVALKITTSILT